MLAWLASFMKSISLIELSWRVTHMNGTLGINCMDLGNEFALISMRLTT
jgi:hypothetical protein